MQRHALGDAKAAVSRTTAEMGTAKNASGMIAPTIVSIGSVRHAFEFNAPNPLKKRAGDCKGFVIGDSEFKCLSRAVILPVFHHCCPKPPELRIEGVHFAGILALQSRFP